MSEKNPDRTPRPEGPAMFLDAADVPLEARAPGTDNLTVTFAIMPGAGSGTGSVDADGRLVDGVWRGWDQAEATAWCAALFPYRRSHFVSWFTAVPFKEGWSDFSERGILPPWRRWPEDAAMYRAAGFTPADFEAQQRAAGVTRWDPVTDGVVAD